MAALQTQLSTAASVAPRGTLSDIGEAEAGVSGVGGGSSVREEAGSVREEEAWGGGSVQEDVGFRAPNMDGSQALRGGLALAAAPALYLLGLLLLPSVLALATLRWAAHAAGDAARASRAVLGPLASVGTARRQQPPLPQSPKLPPAQLPPASPPPS